MKADDERKERLERALQNAAADAEALRMDALALYTDVQDAYATEAELDGDFARAAMLFRASGDYGKAFGLYARGGQPEKNLDMLLDAVANIDARRGKVDFLADIPAESVAAFLETLPVETRLAFGKVMANRLEETTRGPLIGVTRVTDDPFAAEEGYEVPHHAGSRIEPEAAVYALELVRLTGHDMPDGDTTVSWEKFIADGEPADAVPEVGTAVPEDTHPPEEQDGL